MQRVARCIACAVEVATWRRVRAIGAPMWLVMCRRLRALVSCALQQFVKLFTAYATMTAQWGRR